MTDRTMSSALAFSKYDNFELIDGTDAKYRLNDLVTWECGWKGSGLIIELDSRPFDISVPKPPNWWPNWLGWPLYWLQSVHDRLVLLAAKLHDQILEEGGDFAFASAEFRRALLARGVNPAKSWALYLLTLAWTAFGQAKKSASS